MRLFHPLRLLPVLFTLFLLFISVNIQAQANRTIVGRVRDTSEGRLLSSASVLLLRPADSVLFRSVRTASDGIFRFQGIMDGTYILMVTFPKYADYMDTIVISGADRDLSVIPLTTRAQLLQEVIIRRTAAAIRMKGDTTEYRADSFHVAPNADVQELLKRMPGIQVNARGEITTQGEKVTKVLVDGEEFFSDDPAVVTRNLRADVVDKVQVFDKKSDQATFTGIDDGQREKTINLTLKEDKKNGYFGRLEGGTDFDRYHNGKALSNYFKGKRKLAGYLTTDNSRYESLDWNDAQNYSDGGNTTTTVSDDGGISMTYFGNEDEDVQAGLPNQQTAGVTFRQKLSKGDMMTNLQYQRLGSELTGSGYTRTLLKDAAQISSTDKDQVVDRSRIKANGLYEWGTDSTGLLKMSVRGVSTDRKLAVKFTGATFLEDGQNINSSFRDLTNNESDRDISTMINYRRKLEKKGRTINWSTEIKAGDKSEDGSLRTENLFIGTVGQPNLTERIDQRKQSDQQLFNTQSNFVYTEPLGKKSFLIMKYGLGIARNDAERLSFDRDPTGAYTKRVDSLSNHFLFNTLDNNGSLSYRYVYKKLNFAVSTGIGKTLYRRTDLDNRTEGQVSFLNILPSVNLAYKPKAQRSFDIDYAGRPVNPTLQQLQPIVTNTDPLNLLVGNPDLVQGFTHTLNMNMRDFKVLKSRFIALWGSFSATEHAITNSSFVDAKGLRTTKYVNTDGNYNYNLRMLYNVQVFKRINVGAQLGTQFNRYVNLVNGVRNVNDNRSVSYTFESNHWSDKWFSYYMSFTARQHRAVSSLRSTMPTRYWSYTAYGNVSLSFKKIKAWVDLPLELTMYQRTDIFSQARNIWLVNPSVRKTLTKDDKLEAKLTVFDLLDQNSYVNRNVNSNFITENIQNGIRRNIMFSLLFHFSRNGKPMQ